MKYPLLIKYASRSRPDRMFSVIDNVFDSADDHANIFLLLSLDSDDTSVYNQEVMTKLTKCLKDKNMKVFFAPPNGKIDAYNRDIHHVNNWNYVFHITDFTELVKGYDTRLKNILELHHNRNANHLSVFESLNSDGRNRNKICVASQSLYLKLGSMFNPELLCHFGKEELVARCKNWKGVVNYDSSKAFHKYVHPNWKYLKPDQLLIDNMNYWKKDLETLERLTYEG